MLSKHTQRQILKRQVTRAWKQIEAALYATSYIVIFTVFLVVILDQLLKTRGL